MKSKTSRFLALLLTLAMLLPMVMPVMQAAAAETGTAETQQYDYVADFSDSTEEVEGLPEGWVTHPSFKNGVVTQKEDALYISTKTTNGVFTAFYEQNEYTDYQIEADFTMLDKTDNNRWMGFAYRANADDAGTNIFAVKYSNIAVLHSYYSAAVTGFDGTVMNKGWTPSGNAYFPQVKFSSTSFPELVNAPQTKVHLKMTVVGENLTCYVNDVKVLETTIHNSTQSIGSFGIATAMADIKVENFKVIDLSESEEEEDQSQYSYVAKFSDSAEEIEALPAGWKEHPNYQNGTVTQKDGSMYFKTKSASGICAIYYDQDEYTDYRIEAEMTMLDKTNTARWMGILYRANDDENAVNIFNLTWNNNCATSSYYYKETTGYDGTTQKSWSVADGKYFVKKTFSSTVHPEVLNAAQTRCKFTLEVVGNQITGYINDVKVLEAITHNVTQEKGSFGIATSQADIQIHSFKVTDLTPPEEEITEPYAYVADFADTVTDGLPTGWKQHPNYKAGTFSQNNDAFYFTSKTGSGVGSVYYDQNMYHDYLVSADFTMEDKTDTNRWMAITYRMNGDENSTNMFGIKYNNTAIFQAYYGVATEGYDGSTIARGWAPTDGVYFASNSKIATEHPELAGAGATKVNLKVAIVGGKFYGFVNNIKVLETKIHNAHQALGSFGVATANANVKVENYRAIDLTELNNGDGASIAHGIKLPASVNGKLLAGADLGNYVASTTVSFGDAAASTAKILVAKSGDTELYANVRKDGVVTVTCGDVTQTLGTAAIADTTNVVIKTVYANGAVRVLVDGNEVGYGFALQSLPGKYGYLLDGNTTVTAITLNKTTTNVTAVSFKSELTEIAYGATPDWSKVSLTCQLSDGTVYQPVITSDMITGFDPTRSGTQTLTLTYTHGAKTYTEKFNVTVLDDPANMPLAKVGIITDVHIGANASNLPALEKALAYYKGKDVDAIVCVGDIGHDKMEYLDTFNATVQKVFPNGTDDTVKIYVMGNHDTYAFNNAGYPAGTEAHNAAVEDYFTNTFGVSADAGRAGVNYYKVINDYVFAGLYIQTPIAEREAFLEQVFALPEAQGKPVFLVMHEIPVGSVYIASYNPNSTSEMDMHDVLKNYPNAVVLAGHSHNPLADERALWQGEYTVVSCGALFGPIVEENMYEGGSVNGSFQPGNWDAKAALYMEIRQAGVNIERYDFTNDEKLGKDWFIPVNDGVVDRTPYNYDLRTQAAVAPEFAEDAQIVAQPLSESMIKITFPGCFTVYENMDDIVHSYIIRAYNDDTGELVATKRILSQHYLGRVAEKDSYTLTYTGLNSRTNYRFEVVAVESYQKESKPLVVKADTKAFSTEGLTATFYANFDYEWDALAFDTYNHKTSDTITFADGVLRAKASNSSKTMIKDLTFANGTIETLISMNSSAANINGGIYLFASGAADEQDTITAYNVHVDSSVGSRDLQIALYKFSGKYDKCLTSLILKDYFADGNTKASVNLKVEVSNGVLSMFVDGECVLTYTVGSMSGGVGLRSHYAGSDFDYIKVYETSTEYVAPDTTQLEALFTEAKELLANTEVEGTEGFTGKNLYVTQETYTALEELVNTYDIDLMRAYERHVVQVEAILTEGIAQFKLGMEDPSKNWVAQVGDTKYESVMQAIAEANGEVVKLLASTDEAITVASDLTLDLAGNDLSNVTVSEGAVLTLMDSATDDYTGEYGSATVMGQVNPFAQIEGKTYMVAAEDGVYSAHCYDVALTHISLDASHDALGYKAKLYGDEIVQAHVQGFGYNLWIDGGKVNTYTKTGSDVLTLRLKNILANNGGEMNINATVFVSLQVGEDVNTKTCAQYTTTMKQTLQMVNAAWSYYNEAQQTAVKTLCDKYYNTVRKWGLNNIYAPKPQAETYEAVSGSVFSGTLNGFAVENGKLFPAGGGEGKMILNQAVEGDKSVSVDIYPTSGDLINSAIYLGASDVANAQDSIQALAVIVESTIASNPNRQDIVIGSFPAWKQYHRTVIEGSSALFTGGVKEPVNLKVDISGNDLTVTVSLISNPSKSVTVEYTYADTYDLSGGLVGLRSQYDDSAFDNFKVAGQQTVEYTFDSDADVAGLSFYHANWNGGVKANAAQTLALHKTASFKNGTLVAELNTNGDYTAGIVFGADAEGKSYYLYRVTAGHLAELVKVENGTQTVLDKAYHNAATDTFRRLEVVKDGNTIYCYYYNRFDKVNCYAVYEDPAPLSGDRFGVWSASAGSVFCNVTTSDSMNIRKADVLIFGHSYTEMWTDYKTYFPEYTSIDNIGIGGSVATQWEALADEVAAYEPKLGIYNIGINDLTGNMEPEAVVESVENALLDMKAALPGFEVVLVSVSHCPARATLTAQISRTNALMRNLAASYDWVYYAEAEYLFCTDPSDPLSTDASLFIDGLHPSAAGYQLMTDVIRSAINGENQPEYDEALGQEQFETAKKKLLNAVGLYTKDAYTAENWVKAEPYYTAAMNKIIACTTVTEIKALDLSAEFAALAAIPNKSVNVIGNVAAADAQNSLNTENWVKTGDQTLRVSGYSYALDNTSFNSDSEVVFSITNNTGVVGTGGVFLRATAKDNDGIEGYLINYVSSGNYMQVYYINNTYNTDGTVYLQTYLGGIAYGSTGDIIGTEFYAKIEGDKLYLSTLERHLAGQEPLLVVDLTYNGVYDVYESGYFGVLSWNTDTVFDFNLEHFMGNVKTDTSVASVDGIYYDSVTEAAQKANGSVVKMLTDCQEAITIDKAAILDLAGYTLSNVTVADGISLKLIDSTTVSGAGTYGSAAVSGKVETSAEVNGKTYLVVSENNVYSAHFYDVAITKINLDSEKDALTFEAKLSGDQVVLSKLSALGMRIGVDGEEPVIQQVTDSHVITASVSNIMANNGGEKNIQVSAFVTLGQDISKETTQQTTSMKQVVERINSTWNRFSKAQKAEVQAFVNQHAAAMASWSVDQITSWTAEDNVLKILTVGNSFSVDSMEYFYQIAQAVGVENIVLGDLYIGACSLDTHLANLKSGKAAYTYYQNNTGTWTTVSNYTMQAAIESEEWDYICIQPNNASWDPNSYAPLNDLIDGIAELCPDAKFMWNMYWAYPEGSSHHAFPSYGGTQEAMYAKILETTQELIATNEKISIVIPAGTVIQNARTSFLGDTLTRDNCHLNDIGKYIVGIAWVEAITGIEITDLEFCPQGVSEDVVAVAIESVRNAMDKPYELTQSQYTQAP